MTGQGQQIAVGCDGFGQPIDLIGLYGHPLERRSTGEMNQVEAKEIVGGYFMVKAADYEEAVTLSKTCPHLRYGGRIELREIHPMHG